MDKFTCLIIGFGVRAGDVDGVALCRLFNSAISAKGCSALPPFWQWRIISIPALIRVFSGDTF